jgi:peptidoglycan/xylan/chitin deacetylase (PgdA/CDA1 family)
MIGGSDVLVLAQDAARRRRIMNVLATADRVAVVSADLREKLCHFGIDPSKIHVVYRGVDRGLFTPGDRASARRRLEISPEGPVLLWVGRMVPVKGLDVLIDAFTLLRSRQPNCHLYLVGDGPLRRKLEQRVASLDLSRFCIFTGAVNHARLADWYRAADLTLLPSLSEGIPNVLRESQACGTSFVASRVGGISEIADDDRDVLVPPGDAPALAAGIERGLTQNSGYVAVRAPGGEWADSARSLIGLLEPLVAVSANGRSQQSTSGHASPWRQLGRWAMAATLPRQRLLVRGPARCRAVCLTFDDGPHRDHTPRLLDVLKTHGIRATFFVIGERAEQHPDLIRRIVDEGHCIGHHSYTHSNPARTSADELLDEIQRTQKLLGTVATRTSMLFRPPYGKLSAGKFWKLTQAGFHIVLWNSDPKDYARRSADEIRNWFAERPLQSGHVVLMHDSHPYAAELIPDLAAEAQGRGLSFATVNEWVV